MLSFSRVRKALPGFTLDVAWEAGDGVVALFGPSGAGKTLTLQCLAGLVRPDAGRIVVNGRVFFDGATGVHLPPQRRRLGYVFQGYALFPHLTVAGQRRLRPARSPARRAAAARRRRCSSGSGLADLAAGARASSRAASSSAWPSAARSRRTRSCCCSTSRSRRWTRRSAGQLRDELGADR